MGLTLDPTQIQDIESARQAIIELFNLVEELQQENVKLRTENQRLRDENNRLKGEQGKPDVKPDKKSKSKNYSSERERKKVKTRRKRRKINQLRIDREEVVQIDKTTLPADAQFKGHEAVVVQDISIKSDNIRFLKEKYYSASEKRSYLAELPAGYQGQFGPGVRALVLTQYYACGMTEPKIKEFLEHFEVYVSAGQLSNWLIHNHDPWHQEKDEIYQAGLDSSYWQHIDETGTRVDGVNHYCHIVCNPLYTAYFTRPRKDRLTAIKLLQARADTQFLINDQTQQWLQQFKVPHWIRRQVALWPQDALVSQDELENWVETYFEPGQLMPEFRARVLEAAALSAYYQLTPPAKMPILVSDDASQFQQITPHQALCWVHEGRHYKKLSPIVIYHHHLLADFIKDFWNFYRQLQRYRASPSVAKAQHLSYQFDILFSTQTGYDQLDKRIARTKAKKERLLKVLECPQLPLHNNPAELGARQRVFKRHISYGPRTQAGLAAWDTFMTLAATAKKLGVSFFRYIHDRIAELFALPNLADLIRHRSPASHPVSAA